MWEDPIVAEVHRIRREIMSEFNDDLDAYFRHIQAQQEADQRRGVKYVSLRSRHPHGDEPDTA